MLLFLTIVILTVFVWWHFFREADGSNISTGSLSQSKAQKSGYRAVRIVASNQACRASRRNSRQRYLLMTAPRLPLEQCDRIADCRCGYKYFSDRRSGDDRRQIFGSSAQDTLRGPVNRRAGRDRRRLATAEDEYFDY
jgi:hypothetical protein